MIDGVCLHVVDFKGSVFWSSVEKRTGFENKLSLNPKLRSFVVYHKKMVFASNKNIYFRIYYVEDIKLA